jgi:hypothetical protein
MGSLNRFLTMLLLCTVPAAARAQETLAWRGFVEVHPFLYPETTPSDSARAVVEALARFDGAYRPAPWLRLAGGLDARIDTHDQVDRSFRVDWQDRTVRRPALSLRRLSAAATRGGFSVETGKQFIRWGKADVLNPTDRFAPRDFLTVVHNEFLAVTAVRVAYERGMDTVEAVWSPRLTPSRIPLLDQRWTALPQDAALAAVIDGGARLPRRSQVGARWNHAGSVIELSGSFYDGVNHLPSLQARVTGLPPRVEVARIYPHVRMYGGDVAVPTRWFTVKGEAAYFTSRDPIADTYGIYVVQAERQVGEWFLVGGYAGDFVTRARSTLAFAADRGLARALLGRASLTIDANRSLAFETAVRRNGKGSWVKAEYSQGAGQHWRTTAEVNWIRGEEGDFLGQYRRNSNVNLALRYSF